MRRREFLLQAATTAAGLALSPARLMAEPVRDEVALAFASAREAKPWLLAFATANGERFDAYAELVQGQLPAGLVGTLFRNGPARHEIAGRRYQHWFDGDGLVQSFRFADGRVKHSARFVETQKLTRERAAGRPLVPGFGTSWPDLMPAGNAEEGNASNISVVWHGGRLLSLWEAGAAYDLDPATLATRGPHVWSAEAEGLPFSAHPRVEPDGTLWNFGSAPWAQALVLYRIQPDGRLAETVPIRVAKPSYIHDFVVTERHLVFVLPPLHYQVEGDGKTFLTRHRWDADAPTRWLVIDKTDLSKQRWFEAPGAFQFHFANAWEHGNALRVDVCLYPDAAIMYGDQRDVMWGRSEGESTAQATTLTLDLASGRIDEEARDLRSEFPSINERQVGRRHRYVHSLAVLPNEPAGHPLHNALARQDVDNGKTEIFRYPDHLIPEEHLFVPRRGASDPASGWVIGTAIDVQRAATQLAVFDAEHVDDGPLATLRLPYPLPFGLHGRFVPATDRT